MRVVVDTAPDKVTVFVSPERVTVVAEKVNLGWVTVFVVPGRVTVVAEQVNCGCEECPGTTTELKVEGSEGGYPAPLQVP